MEAISMRVIHTSSRSICPRPVGESGSRTAGRSPSTSCAQKAHRHPSFTVHAAAIKSRVSVKPEKTLDTLIGGVAGINVEDDANQVSFEDYLSADGGPPRFFSPLPQTERFEGEPGTSCISLRDAPLLLFLPGIDGTGMNAFRQYQFLTTAFEVRSFNIPNKDRTPFAELVDIVVEYIEREVEGSPVDRPVYLLGESFGGLIALAVGLRLPDKVHRLVLVNPATSYPDSPWPQLGPLLQDLPDLVYEQLLPLAVSPVMSNPFDMFTGNIPSGLAPWERLEKIGNNATSMLPSMLKLAKLLPKPTLQWRLWLLQEGAAFVNARLGQVQQRVLVVAGEEDRLIPSKEEAARLKRKLPRCSSKLVPGRGHVMLMEDGVDILQVIEECGFYTQRRVMSSAARRRGPSDTGLAGPVEVPTAGEVALDSQGGIDFFRRVTSPVFLSTAADGRVELGLAQLPSARPLLLVGNHQTYAPDLALLVRGMLEEKGLLVRGLAHPFVFGPAFNGTDSDGENKEDKGGEAAVTGRGGAGIFSSYGAVPVTPRNMYRLLQDGEVVLLYPGGVREAYNLRGEEYKLIWPDRPEVIRMAARFNATIVPLSAIGADDVELALDTEEILRTPVLGDWVRERTKNIAPARLGASVSDQVQEQFIAPLPALPSPLKPPNRFYFLFGKPIVTSRADMKDADKSEEQYRELKAGVEDGIHYLLEKRKEDPYGNFYRRQLYELSWGGEKQAPTFDPSK